MNLKKLLGEDYKDDLTIEEINDLLKSKELVEKDSIEVPDLSNYVTKEQYNKASSDAANWKKQYRATLDEAEKTKLELEDAKSKDLEELENLRREVNVAKYEKEYISMGYDSKLATSTANALYDNDMDTVFKNQASFIESTKKEVTKQTLRETPTPPAGSEEASVTKPNVKEMSIDELQKLSSEDPDTFNEITK